MFFRTYFATKADALKDWTGTGCDVRSVSVTDTTGTMLSPTAVILTFAGTADGTCYGHKFDSVIWGTSVYVKEGGVWNVGIRHKSTRSPGGHLEAAAPKCADGVYAGRGPHRFARWDEVLCTKVAS
jgi:hypothetical protein